MTLYASVPLDGVPVVHLAGDIDLANAEEHQQELCRLVDDADAPAMVVNCAHLELLESQGMAMMHRVHMHGVANGVTVVWRGLGPHQRRLLELTALDRYLVLSLIHI